ncbi:MAG: phosphatase PAP2 family protein [Deltaproteobacteria bacterium]|nr:phosphatase PAP2 family protein [Deltaproteobacteria bacterium]
MKWLKISMRRREWLLFGVLYFVAGYYGCAWLTATRASVALHIFSWEAGLPVIPAGIYGYLLPYPAIVLTYLLIRSEVCFRYFVQNIFLVLTIHFLIFLLFPTAMNRSPVPPGHSWSLTLLRHYYTLDPPQNLFPSIHVSLPFLSTLSLWPERRWWRYVMLLATLVICVSVILIKQHYVVDVIGAIGITAVVYTTRRMALSPPVN